MCITISRSGRQQEAEGCWAPFGRLTFVSPPPFTPLRTSLV